MANEVTLENLDSDLHYYSWTAASALTKGTVLVLASDADRKVAWHSTTAQYFLGVAAADNIAGEANGTVTARRRGIMEFTADENITRGQMVMLGGTANCVYPVPNTTISNVDFGKIVGLALDTATDGNRVSVLVGI